MADEKKSSIYDDGSSNGFDEYGEWVTSDPDDISSDELANDNLTGLEADLGMLEAQPLDETGDDLEMSFDTLDLPDEEEEPQEELNVEDILAEDDGFTDDEILLNEFPKEELEPIEKTVVSDVKEILPVVASASSEESADSADAKEVPESHSNTTEVFMENFLDDSPFDDEEDEIPPAQEEKEKFDEPTLVETPVEETIAVTETADGVVPEDADDFVDEMSFDADAALAEAGIPIEQVAEPAAEADVPVEQAEEVPSQAETPVEQVAEPAVEKATESQKTEIAQSFSTELLLRIAEELSSIRKELSSLKQNFLERRGKEAQLESVPIEEPSGSERIEEIVPSAEESESVHSGGFFDDNGDEKIALTGDELDNILMSADFTEEAGAEVTDDFETAADEKILETEASVEDERPIDAEKDSEELQKLREEGVVVPITPSPEDVSLLETEEILQDEKDEGVEEYLDLSDAVIDEPDLQVVENPIQEPALEGISFDDSILDMGDEAFEESHIEEELPEEPEVEIPFPEEKPILEIPEPAAEPAVYEEPVPPVEEVEEAPPAEPIAETQETTETTAGVAIEETTAGAVSGTGVATIPPSIKDELKTVLSYMDQLLESLPEEKIEEFAASKYFDTYKKLFTELGIV
ncbi:MAG: hypothetical protein LBE74_03910 [Treponema sp.]|jgi:hypothetical protein|nr:hypothetical protein [Treponema sp.]